jgi:hypothetical protein
MIPSYIFDRFSQFRFVLVIFLSACFIAQMYRELSKFFDQKTTTSISRKASTNMELPYVTFCTQETLNRNIEGKYY